MRNPSLPNWTWLAAATVVLGLAGCGSVSTPQSSSEAPSQAVITSAAPPSPTSTGEPDQSITAVSPTPATKAKVVVPDGVGKDYQTAQDIWRAAGLHVAPAHDATGAHRLPVIDSNWVVLSQSPKAGTKVDAGSFITATVKKYTDS
jgi:beta-lactam-binding protein with PASTA domain